MIHSLIHWELSAGCKVLIGVIAAQRVMRLFTEEWKAERLSNFIMAITGVTRHALNRSRCSLKRRINGAADQKGRKKIPTPAGFEPARAEPNRFQVCRLNHSAMLPRYVEDRISGRVEQQL